MKLYCRNCGAVITWAYYGHWEHISTQTQLCSGIFSSYVCKRRTVAEPLINTVFTTKEHA